jgi:hypothetical protein
MLLMGSCFTSEIGQQLEKAKFPALANPFGVLYNPVSVYNGLDILLKKRFFSYGDLHYFNQQWFSFYHHGSFSHPDKESCLEQINQSIGQASEHLGDSKFLFITFGTAWAYEHKETREIVSNCHKIPANRFNRFLVKLEDMLDLYRNLLEQLFARLPFARVIFTVSPVRHWKDGPEMNQLSKSMLFVLIHTLIEEFSGCSYFPSYEIMMDDLRDYRFYKKDMLHPNEVAVEYIWNIFGKTYFEDDTLAVCREIEKIKSATEHRPMNPGSEQHQRFVEATRKQISQLQIQYPKLDFSREIEKLTASLHEKGGHASEE